MRRIRPPKLITPLLAVAALALTACGGSADATSDDGSSNGEANAGDTDTQGAADDEVDDGGDAQGADEVVLDDEPVNFGNFSPGISFTPLRFAIDNGFFEAEGIDASYYEFDGGGPGAAAFVAGEIDAAIAGTGSTVQAVGSGALEAKFIYGFINRSEYDFVVREGIESLDDLVGGTVAARPGSQTDLITRALLLDAGYEPDEQFGLIDAGNDAERLAALTAGHIDASLFSSINRDRFADAGGHILIAAEDSVPLPTSGILASQALIDERPEVARAIVRGFDRAIAYVQDPANQDEVAAYIVETLGATEEDAAIGAEEIAAPGRIAAGGELPTEPYDLLLEVAATVDDRIASLTYDDLVDTQFLGG